MKYYLILFFIFLLPLTSHAQQQLTADQISDLSTAIRQEMNDSGAPGAVFAIIKNEEIIYQQAFGLTNTETQLPMKTETIFPIGSVTKLFTALALMSAMEEQNLDMNTTVSSIVKGLPDYTSDITIHHLLSNSSGMIDSISTDIPYQGSIFDYFAKTKGGNLFAEPGEVFSYSNNGFSLAGLLLSTLANKSYVDAIEHYITKPLDMNKTTFNLEEVVAHSFATGHDGKMKPAATGIINPAAYPAGGLYSNIYDLSELATSFMNKSVFNGIVIDKMSTGYGNMGALRRYMGYPGSKYGYGSIVFKRKGISYVANAGEAGTVNTLFVMAPEHKTAFIVLSNAGYHPFMISIEKAMDILFPDAVEEVVELPAEKTSELVGKYYQPNIEGTKDNITEILIKDGKLAIGFSPDIIYPLNRVSEMTYSYADPNFTMLLEIAFYPDKSGKIKYLNSIWRTSVKLN